MHFGLPNSARTINTEGVVVHVTEVGDNPLSPAGFGVRFVGLADDDRSALASHVELEALAPV